MEAWLEKALRREGENPAARLKWRVCRTLHTWPGGWSALRCGLHLILDRQEAEPGEGEVNPGFDLSRFYELRKGATE